MSTTDYRFIIYACPVGELNSQIKTYFAQSKQYGINKAHKYMPHCTLTGFFADDISSIDFYIRALETAYLLAKKKNISLDVNIKKLILSKDWHGIELQAAGLKKLIIDFAQLATSPTRQENLRLKDWYHLSLAYGFNSQYAAELKTLATETINIQANVNWELRFYHKNPDWTWNCLQSWNLS